MKKILSVLIALSMAASCALLASCGKKDDPKTPSESTAAVTEAGTKTPDESKTSETKAPETKAPETKAPETKAPETTEPGKSVSLNRYVELASVSSDNPVYSSSLHGEESADSIFDEDEFTKWCLDFDPDNVPTVIFSTTQPVSISSFDFWSGDDTQDYPGRNPAHFTLSGSSDEGSTWTLLIDRDLDMEPYSSFPCETVNLDNPTEAYSLFKLSITSTLGDPIMQISQFNMFGTAN